MAAVEEVLMWQGWQRESEAWILHWGEDSLCKQQNAHTDFAPLIPDVGRSSGKHRSLNFVLDEIWLIKPALEGCCEMPTYSCCWVPPAVSLLHTQCFWIQQGWFASFASIKENPCNNSRWLTQSWHRRLPKEDHFHHCSTLCKRDAAEIRPVHHPSVTQTKRGCRNVVLKQHSFLNFLEKYKRILGDLQHQLLYSGSQGERSWCGSVPACKTLQVTWGHFSQRCLFFTPAGVEDVRHWGSGPWASAGCLLVQWQLLECVVGSVGVLDWWWCDSQPSASHFVVQVTTFTEWKEVRKYTMQNPIILTCNPKEGLRKKKSPWGGKPQGKTSQKLGTSGERDPTIFRLRSP